MGTSKSQGSPPTAPWNAVRAAYGDPSHSPERLARLVWRANSRDGDNDLSGILSGSEVLASFQAIGRADTREDAVEAVTRAGALAERPTIATDLARRAAVRAFEESNRGAAFVAALFDEATNYLVSRDLPGHVGTSPILENVRLARARKASVRDAARRTASQVALATEPPANAKQWRDLVRVICLGLRDA